MPTVLTRKQLDGWCHEGVIVWPGFAARAAVEALKQAFAQMLQHDAGWVAGRLAEILPVADVHKQHCLELDDPVERLRYLRPMFEIGYR